MAPGPKRRRPSSKRCLLLRGCVLGGTNDLAQHDVDLLAQAKQEG